MNYWLRRKKYAPVAILDSRGIPTEQTYVRVAGIRSDGVMYYAEKLGLAADSSETIDTVHAELFDRMDSFISDITTVPLCGIDAYKDQRGWVEESPVVLE